MNLSKRAVTAISFSLGTVLFVSTAFADVALGSGYDKLKNALKTTTDQISIKENNYTGEYLLTITDNGKSLVQVSFTGKMDNKKQAREEKTITKLTSGASSSDYSYRDPTVIINSDRTTADKYYVTTLSAKNSVDESFISNPFKENGAAEVEKIIDLVIGNLKSEVQSSEKSDGSQEFSGSLTEAQVPALINAISSFGIKRMMPNKEYGNNMMPDVNNDVMLPMLDSDIYIKKVSGTAKQSKLGIIESTQGEVLLGGKEKNGTVHELSLSVVAKITDFGKTVVTKPDLTGKIVEKVSAMDTFGNEYAGKYRSEMIVKKDGKFVKVGERIIVIAHVDDKTVEGRFYETIKPGFEEYASKYEFTFAFSQDDPSNSFTYTNPKGEKEQGQIHGGSVGRLYVDLNSGNKSNNSGINTIKDLYIDNTFSKVFDE